MSFADPRSQPLDELTQIAYRLGLAFGAAAERTEAWGRKLEYFQLFDRCFFSVRVAMALQLRLRREFAAPRAGRREDLRTERDPPEREPSDAAALARYDERDREREAASLPLLLKTLESVAADAAALPGPESAALPTLRELLAKFASVPAGEPPVKARAPRPATPPSSPGLRARLAGSGADSVMTLAPAARPPPGFVMPLRRATGPPPR